MAGDPYFADVISLNHFDGADNATSSPDVIAGRTWEFVGNAKLVAAQGMLGSASALYLPNGGRVKLTGLPAFGTGDFAIEFLIKGSNVAAEQVIWDQRPGANGQYLHLSVSGTNVFTIMVASGVIKTSANFFTANIRQVRILRVSGTLALWIDGAQVGTPVAFTNNLLAGSQVWFGANVFSLNSGYLNGYIDELRVTTGEGASQRSGSLIQTEPFPDVAGGGGGLFTSNMRPGIGINLGIGI